MQICDPIKTTQAGVTTRLPSSHSSKGDDESQWEREQEI